MKLQQEFFDIYSQKNNYNKIIIDIDEENNSSEEKDYSNFENLDEEINYVNYLIKITQEKLLSYENNNNNKNNFNKNNEKKLTLTYQDILEINDQTNKDENMGLICAKSEDKINVEYNHLNEARQNLNQKKFDLNFGKQLGNNEELLSLGPYFNQLIISSKNNLPINLELIEPKQLKQKEEKEKFKLNQYKTIFDKENMSINTIDPIINENNANKIELNNFNPMKNLHVENKIRKDSVFSDIPCYGNLSSNPFMDPSLFSNISYLNGFNSFNVSLNKNENEVF